MQGEDNLDEFSPMSIHNIALGLRARFVAPIGYGDNLNKNLENLVSEWLQREESKIDPKTLMQNIRRQGLQDRMKTGLMFNMIMKMLITDNPINNPSMQRGYQIYQTSVRQELAKNWKIFVSAHKSDRKFRVLTQEL
jgi:hypothetical protein